MGDRAQVCIKDGEDRVYLYGHWSGTGIYKAAAKALRRVPGRWTDSEYLARAIFCEMVRDDIDGETGYGIGLHQHGDIEHAIPVFDCETRQVTWESHDGEPVAPGNNCAFVDFASRALAGHFNNL